MQIELEIIELWRQISPVDSRAEVSAKEAVCLSILRIHTRNVHTVLVNCFFGEMSTRRRIVIKDELENSEMKKIACVTKA